MRLAVTDLWKNRPDIADQVSLEALTNDPEVTIRRSAAAAAVAAERYELLRPMTQDPDASVRREVALVLGGAQPMRSPGLAILDLLAADRDMAVRAAAYVAHLLQGIALSLPPELDPRITADRSDTPRTCPPCGRAHAQRPRTSSASLPPWRSLYSRTRWRKRWHASTLLPVYGTALLEPWSC